MQKIFETRFSFQIFESPLIFVINYMNIVSLLSSIIVEKRVILQNIFDIIMNNWKVANLTFSFWSDHTQEKDSILKSNLLRLKYITSFRQNWSLFMIFGALLPQRRSFINFGYQNGNFKKHQERYPQYWMALVNLSPLTFCDWGRITLRGAGRSLCDAQGQSSGPLNDHAVPLWLNCCPHHFLSEISSYKIRFGGIFQ